MRIVMISHTRFPWILDHARFLGSRGCAIKVVTFSPDQSAGMITECVGPEVFDLNKNKHLFLTRVPRIRRIIRDFCPDLVFAPYLVSNGLSAVLSWRGPTVVCAVGGDVLNHAGRSGWRLWLRRRVIRFVCHRADLVETVSQDLSDELMSLGVPEMKLLYLPFGVDHEVFHPSADAPRNRATRFICTRRHERIYDIATIIDALALLRTRGRDFHCTFTSDGALLESHKARVAGSGLEGRVTFTGNLEHGELPGLLREADIYISASLGDGTSVSLLEAMASGLFPVVSRIKANLPWVEHGRTGLLFDCGRPEDLAEALEMAMENAAVRTAACELNRDRVRRDANMTTNMDRLAECFEQLVRAHGRH